MKKILLSLIILANFSLSLFAVEPTSPTILSVSAKMEKNHKMPFILRDSALALNVEYGEIKKLREQIQTTISRPLKFFTDWESAGEAHVTTITPPEFQGSLKKFLSMEAINQTAIHMKIQSSTLEIKGIGSGKKIIKGKEEETFFVIVDSKELRNLRQAIFEKYVKNGGPPDSFKPHWFFPHITIGYTLQDLHEPDVIKDIEHGLDPRFMLKIMR